MNEEMKKKQIEAIKKIRRQFADEVYWCLENWLDALDERSRIFRAQELVGFEEDYEEK